MKLLMKHARFEVFTAVTMKNGDVLRDVTACGSRKNRRFVGT
jgi:hypothetical protein